MNFEETVTFCSNWFEENQVEIPKTAQEWCKGRSGKTVPPKCTYGTLRRRGIQVGNLLEKLLPDYKNRIKNAEDRYDWFAPLGLTFIKECEGELVQYVCNSCNETLKTRKGTLRRWQSAGHKHCSTCRGATGKSKDHTYYQKFLSEDFSTVELSGRTLTIKHDVCGTVFTRVAGYITGSQRTSETLACPSCYSGFVSGKIGEYSSLIEKEIIEYLESRFPEVVFQREKLYKDLVPTSREYRADIWIPEMNLVIEITSKGNNLPNYHENLKIKLDLLHKNNIKAFYVTSKSELEDIVRPLLKNRE